jgi:protein O-GlcNAc transferase
MAQRWTSVCATWALVCVAALEVSCATAPHRRSRHAVKTGPAAAASGGTALPTVEATDGALSSALLALAIAPGAAAERRVAEQYRALGILDAASDHFSRAVVHDPADAASYEGLARIWRDWGFPHLGLGDAARAVYYAPASAAAHNTLGTILAAIGDRGDARREYERALALDPDAAYALNNLCFLSLREGDTSRAVNECHAALAIDPGFAAARLNLASAERAAGR